MTPKLILIAGPNGAGKSTLFETRVATSFAGPFINTDIIQRNEMGDASPSASYEAAKIAKVSYAQIATFAKLWSGGHLDGANGPNPTFADIAANGSFFVHID